MNETQIAAADFEAERLKVKGYVDEILTAAGRQDLIDKITIRSYGIFEVLLGGKQYDDASAGIHSITKEIAIFFTPGATTNYPQDKFKAILAHEVGHVVLGHVEDFTYDRAKQRGRELDADAFAGRLGYADGLIEVFTHSHLQGIRSPGEEEESTHPSYAQRIEQLQAIKEGVEVPAHA